MDDYGISAGAKSVNESIKVGRAAGKEIGKTIEESQKEAIEIASQQANARIRERKQEEYKKQHALFKAYDQYTHRQAILKEEEKLKADFVKKHGIKEWQKLLDIKNEIEKLEKSDKKFFDSELAKVRRVQLWCFLTAACISWYVVWGYKW